MAALASEVRKKEESKELRYCREEDRNKVLKRKGVKRRVKKKTKQKCKERKSSWRNKWMKLISQEAKQVIFNKWTDNKKKGQKKGKNGNRGKKEGPKLPMHQKLKIYANNERGINTIAKRQQLAASWLEEKIDVAMMGETQKNTGGMQQGPSWNNEYITFFSTGIHPKIREEQEKKRLNKWDRQAKKRKRKIEKGQNNLQNHSLSNNEY